jgi:hypothetical protein
MGRRSLSDVKLIIKTTDQQGKLSLSAGGGNNRLIKPQQLCNWVEKYLKRTIAKGELASELGGKTASISVQVKYIGDKAVSGEDMTNETIRSTDFNYLYNTTLFFLEDFISRESLLNNLR